ncbi:MAG: hypothetical protein ACYSU6_02460 [Planctomycetota bacterium]|jgi:hypothetical protein
MIAHDPKSLCQQVKPYYYEYLTHKHQERIPAQMLKHIDKCRHCQKQLGQLNTVLAQAYSLESQWKQHSLSVTTMLKLHFAYIGKPVTCSIVKPFLPTLLDQALRVSLPTPITAHLDNCDRCSEDLDKIRNLNLDQEQLCRLSQLFAEKRSEDDTVQPEQLRNAIRNIADRPESNAVTTYNIDKSAEAQYPSESDHIYAGYPIRVEVGNREDEVKAERSVWTLDFGKALKQKMSEINLRPFIRGLAAAAAVALIAVALFLNTPAAKALTINEVYKFIEQIKNVYIAKFVPGKQEAVLERWVSRTSKIYMTKTAKELVLWDIPNGVRKSRSLEAAVIKTTHLTDDSVADIEERMRGSLGLMPFYDIYELPEGAEWVRIPEGDLKHIAAATEVYDLKWTIELPDKSVVSKKWRFFVDTNAGIPQRIEVYVQLPIEEAYTLDTTIIVQYLSDDEMQSTVKDSSL